jgi:hypothetical protein
MPILSAHLHFRIESGHQKRDNSSLGHNSSSSEALVARDNLDNAVNALYVKPALSSKKASKDYLCHRCSSHTHTHRENDCTHRRPKDDEFADNAVSQFTDNDRLIEHLPWSDATRWELWLR